MTHFHENKIKQKKKVAEKQKFPTSYAEKIRLTQSFIGKGHKDGIGNCKTKINEETCPHQIPDKPGACTLGIEHGDSGLLMSRRAGNHQYS